MRPARWRLISRSCRNCSMAARQSDSTGGRAATQRTLCIDHSVVTHEASWPALAHSLASGKLRLALSLWNLVEIGAASDKAQQRRRLTFLEKFNPLWIVERVSIQKQEVQGFLWKNVFRAAPTEPQVFTPHLSVVDSYHEGHKARIGLTASQWIAGIDFEGIEKRKDLAPNALKFLQTVDRQTLEDREDEIFKPWIEPLLPTADPDGRALTKVRGAELLIPIPRELDSPGDSRIRSAVIQDGNQGGCHGPGYCGADGIHGRRGSRVCETSEGRCAGATVVGDCGGARSSLAGRQRSAGWIGRRCGTG